LGRGPAPRLTIGPILGTDGNLSLDSTGQRRGLEQQGLCVERNVAVARVFVEGAAGFAARCTPSFGESLAHVGARWRPSAGRVSAGVLAREELTRLAELIERLSQQGLGIERNVAVAHACVEGAAGFVWLEPSQHRPPKTFLHTSARGAETGPPYGVPSAC
jgi:hypothetical protein